MAVTFDTATTSSFGPGTVNTSPTVVNWSHNNTGNFLVVFFEEFTGVGITARSATFNGVAMTALTNNGFYLSNPPVGNFTISVSLTHSGSWTGSGIAYAAASYKAASTVGQPKNYTDVSNGTNTISSSVVLPSLGAWHIGCGMEYGNGSGITGSTSLRNSQNIPNSSQFIGIIDSNGGGSYPGNVTLSSNNTSTLNQGSRLVSFMLENALSSSNFLSFF